MLVRSTHTRNRNIYRNRYLIFDMLVFVINTGEREGICEKQILFSLKNLGIKNNVCANNYNFCSNFADLDKCKAGSHSCKASNAVCKNTLGSHSCDCQNGFSGDGRTTCSARSPICLSFELWSANRVIFRSFFDEHFIESALENN